MSEDKEIVRYTLQSFVGPHITNTDLSARQKEAIQRLIYLTPEKFDGLCADVVNEIHRRSGMSFNKPGQLQEKLTKLSVDKFRNLVIDTLLVFNYKNPGTKPMEVEEFLSNLENLIADLKIKSEKEKFINKIKGLSFANKMMEYNKFLRKSKSLDPDVVEEMERVIEAEIKNNTHKLVEYIGYPKVFVSHLDETEIADDRQYKYHRSNLMKLVDSHESSKKEKDPKDLDGNKESSRENFHADSILRERSIKSELKQILGLCIDRSDIPVENVEYFHGEIKKIIKVCEKVKKDINGETCVNLEEISRVLTEVIDDLIEKTVRIDPSNDEFINNLQLQKVSIETLKESPTKSDAFSQIVLLVEEITKEFGK